MTNNRFSDSKLVWDSVQAQVSKIYQTLQSCLVNKGRILLLYKGRQNVFVFKVAQQLSKYYYGTYLDLFLNPLGVKTTLDRLGRDISFVSIFPGIRLKYHPDRQCKRSARAFRLRQVVSEH